MHLCEVRKQHYHMKKEKRAEAPDHQAMNCTNYIHIELKLLLGLFVDLNWFDFD